MPMERREQAIAIWLGSTGNGRNPMFNVKPQPSSHHNSQGGRVRETCGYDHCSQSLSDGGFGKPFQQILRLAAAALTRI